MSWEDRLQQAAYTSPTGARVVFSYEAVRRTVDKRTSAFEFRNVDGAYVQDNGFGARKYPLRCFFWGADHDLEAAEFEATLLESGIGRLEHPFYGTFDAMPFGGISRRDDLKSAANQSIVEVTFWSVIREVYPRLLVDPRNEILAALGDFNAAAPAQFQTQVSLDSVTDQAAAKSAISTHVALGDQFLGTIAKETKEARQLYERTKRELDTGLDVLIMERDALSNAIVTLVQAPAQAQTEILSRIEGYGDFIDSIFGSLYGKPEEAPRIDSTVVNGLHISDLTAAAGVSGAALSTVEHTFETRPRALDSADRVLSMFDDFVSWRDSGFETVDRIDPGGTYQALHRLVASVAGFLIEASFTLLPERRIVLGRPRTIIDLAAELYGEVDQRLDFLIRTNGLTGSEILELPAGRSIVYYV